MSTGGDYEPAFTVGPDGLQAARKVCALTVIREMVVVEEIWVVQGGQRRRVEAMGYEHRIACRSSYQYFSFTSLKNSSNLIHLTSRPLHTFGIFGLTGLLLGFSDVTTVQALHLARAIRNGSASGIVLFKSTRPGNFSRML